MEHETNSSRAYVLVDASPELRVGARGDLVSRDGIRYGGINRRHFLNGGRFADYKVESNSPVRIKFKRSQVSYIRGLAVVNLGPEIIGMSLETKFIDPEEGDAVPRIKHTQILASIEPMQAGRITGSELAMWDRNTEIPIQMAEKDKKFQGASTMPALILSVR